jgi:TnsA-like endonuclease N terminal/NUMOD3 motif
MLLEVLPIQNRFHKDKTPIHSIRMKCDVCGSEFTREDKRFLVAKIHRCSKKCVYGHRKSDGLGGHGADLVKKPCGLCGKDVTNQRSQCINKKQFFCTRKCYGKWLSAHPETYAENTKKMHTLEVAKKISEAVQMRMSQSDYVHPRLGTLHSEETKQAISRQHIESGCVAGKNNGMFGRKHTDLARDKMSDVVSDAFTKGLRRPYGKNSHQRGTHISTKMNKEMHYRSSWELAMMKHLDNDIAVSSFESESVRISYFYNDHKRWYVPDFIITYSDGSRKMIEIKPQEFVLSEKNVLKEAAGKAFCLLNGISQYYVLTGQMLRDQGIL